VTTRPAVRSPDDATPHAAGAAPAAALDAAFASGFFPVVLLLALAVLGTGLFFPHLVYEDSAQDAVMAMRMHQENDWTHLLKNGQPYLDKPHLLFWSAMAAYRLFGVHEWSYRLPSVLVTLLGAWSTYALGRRLHSATVGKVAAVMFLTAYATVLGNHDVRMDALLTGFVAFGVWQLVTWLDTGRAGAMALGAAGIGLAFSAKGSIAIAAAGAPLLFHVWSRGLWPRLRSWQLLLGIACFAAAIAPVLVAYWLQFDRHPELVVEGRTGVSGVRFILLGQTLDRFGGGKGARHTGDPLFLYHSLLWAFLPWCLLTFAAWADRVRELVRERGRAFRARDQVSFLGPFVAIAALSVSRYKLAHYVNVFLPLLAILCAAWLEEAWREGRLRRLARLRAVQGAVVAVMLAAVVLLNGWSFPPRAAWIVAVALGLAALLAFALRLRHPLHAVWVPSAIAVSLGSFVQNANYQPWLGHYQLGDDEAAEMLAMDLDWSRVRFLDRIEQPLQFYTRHAIPRIELDAIPRELAVGGPLTIVTREPGREALGQAGVPFRVRTTFRSCGVLKMRPAILDPRRREQEACRPVYLLDVGG
jgi:4-amino-4-deoxy-L-arabinose transferase-like glycosyltransferase